MNTYNNVLIQILSYHDFHIYPYNQEGIDTLWSMSDPTWTIVLSHLSQYLLAIPFLMIIFLTLTIGPFNYIIIIKSYSGPKPKI